MKVRFTYITLLLISSLALVSSLTVDIPIPLNLNGTNWTMNVNNTDCWLGHCTTDGSWLTGISTYNSTYNSIRNPFDQSLNQTDIVKFGYVNASTFRTGPTILSGTSLSGITSLEFGSSANVLGNVNFLGNVTLSGSSGGGKLTAISISDGVGQMSGGSLTGMVGGTFSSLLTFERFSTPTGVSLTGNSLWGISVLHAPDLLIGINSSETLAFWGKAPISQPANSTAIDTLLANTGLRALGGTANFDTNISTTKNISAGYYFGDGSQLTNIPNYNATYESTFNATYDAKADYQFTNNNFNGSSNYTNGRVEFFGDTDNAGFKIWRYANRTGTSFSCFVAPLNGQMQCSGDSVFDFNFPNVAISTTGVNRQTWSTTITTISLDANFTKNITVGKLIKLTPIAIPTCDTTTNGSIGRNLTDNKPYYCDGGVWNVLY